MRDKGSNHGLEIPSDWLAVETVRGKTTILHTDLHYVGVVMAIVVIRPIVSSIIVSF